jgi:hypothetical protein
MKRREGGATKCKISFISEAMGILPEFCVFFVQNGSLSSFRCGQRDLEGDDLVFCVLFHSSEFADAPVDAVGLSAQTQ